MRNFRVATDINAPVERVWSTLADVERWPEWTASIARVEPLNQLPLSLGARVQIHQPKLRPAVWEVTVWEPPRRFVWQSSSFGVTAIADHVIEARAAGCSVTLTLHFGGALGGLVGRLAGRLTAQYIQLEATGLKARAEGAT
jgi:uncharacterized membrane protein